MKTRSEPLDLLAPTSSSLCRPHRATVFPLFRPFPSGSSFHFPSLSFSLPVHSTILFSTQCLVPCCLVSILLQFLLSVLKKNLPLLSFKVSLTSCLEWLISMLFLYVHIIKKNVVGFGVNHMKVVVYVYCFQRGEHFPGIKGDFVPLFQHQVLHHE